MDHLSSVDASFLHLETPETPMHVGSLMLFELPAGYKGDYFEEVKALIARRMHLCTVFHRKLAQMPFELADPVWIEDDDVDLDYHVRSLVLRRPGTMTQLEALIARLHSSLLDRSRPLWEVYVIEGLQDGRIAYYTKAHHSGIDGKAGVELAKVLYDTTPEMREVPPARRTRGVNPYQLGVAELLRAALTNTAKQYVKVGKLIPTAVKALGAAGKIVATRKTAKGERNLNLGLAPKTIFNASITNQRSFSTLSVPLGDIKSLGKRVGGTVNTVVMAMCSGALRRFLLERDLLPKQSLIAAVPVSLRTADDSSMNNQVSMIRVDLATDIADVAARFKAIHASSEAAKSVVSELKPVLGADAPIAGSPWVMTGLASLYGRSGLAGRLPPAANVCISNVPGLPMPLYLAGARMAHFYPVSIPYHGMALNMTVQSYAGQLEFGLTACRRALSQPESDELIEHLRKALLEIQGLESVGEAPTGTGTGTRSDSDCEGETSGNKNRGIEEDCADDEGQITEAGRQGQASRTRPRTGREGEARDMTEPIPQPKGEPFIGNVRAVDSDAPMQALMRLARIHGPIFQLDFFGKRAIFVSSHALIDELCDERRFDKRVHGDLKNIRDFAGDGLFTARTNEPNWALAHRLLMPAFGPIGIRGMFDQMLDIADQMLLRWDRFGPRAVIDVADDMTRLTLDTIALCAFDTRFNSFYRNEMHPFVGAMVDALREAGARGRRPEIATRLLVRTRRAYEDGIRLMHEVADGVIADRRRDPNAAQKKDLLAIMMQGRDAATGAGLSDENIRYQLVTFLIAGHETTSGMLSFALHFLMKNPQVLNKARAEVDAVLGTEAPRVEQVGRLRYVEQVLMETLRIWPTAPAFALRPNEDTVIGGRYAVKTHDAIFALLPMLHRDPSVWGEDVEVFRPERMEATAMEQLPANAWKPFGNGQRACIGRPFAMQEAQLVLAMILQRFDLVEDDPSYQLEISETLTLKPHGVRMRVKRRGEAPVPLSSLRSAVVAAPRSKPLAASAAPAAAGNATPLLVLYGSNTGSAEAFAQRIASDAPSQGYAVQAAALDDYCDRLPTAGATLILAASYEGQAPDNARQFVTWLDTLAPAQLKDVRYSVFGCGNRQWARTYQAVPKRIDAALEAAGATRLRPRGEADASGDFFGAFDEWYEGLWADLAAALGKELQAAPSGAQLSVEVVSAGRSTILRQGDLLHGEVVENRELVDMSSKLARPKRHIEIALPAGMSYRAGDYLAVLPRNPQGNVLRALRRFDFAADSQVVIHKAEGSLTSLPADYPVGVGDLLFHYVELAQPATRGQVTALAAATRCPPEKAELEALAGEDAYQRKVLGKRVSVLDLLERFASCELGFAAFLEMLPPIRARQYSISSSPLWNDTHCTLTVAVVDAPALSGQGHYRGLASTHLAECAPGTHVAVAVRASNTHFHPPPSPETPMIMVCAGTGLAPFRGFLQERAVQAENGQRVGPALLFFGCDHPEVDYLYRDELAAWEAAGVVSVRPAFCEAPEGEVVFVQHRLWKDRADVAALFQKGAHVYVCGDGRRMAPAVRETFVRIYREAAGATMDAAEHWFEKIERETGRYVADVFA